jgi:hypothetical protein
MLSPHKKSARLSPDASDYYSLTEKEKSCKLGLAAEKLPGARAPIFLRRFSHPNNITE